MEQWSRKEGSTNHSIGCGAKEIKIKEKNIIVKSRRGRDKRKRGP
jgi:hypothetical protein